MQRMFVPAILAAALMVAPAGASAATITFTLHEEFSGAQQPAGSITATFTDVVGGVELTMDASGLVGTEFVSEWYFNLDPTLDPTQLVFMWDATSGGEAENISNSVDCCKADGDGKYDILFAFSTNPPRFGPDFTTSVYLISGIVGLTANSFDFDSAPDGGHGPFKSAAHIQGIGATGQGSGWIRPNGGDEEEEQEPVPEPTSLALLGLAALAGGARLRRRTV